MGLGPFLRHWFDDDLFLVMFGLLLLGGQTAWALNEWLTARNRRQPWFKRHSKKGWWPWWLIR